MGRATLYHMRIDPSKQAWNPEIGLYIYIFILTKEIPFPWANFQAPWVLCCFRARFIIQKVDADGRNTRGTPRESCALEWLSP